MKKRIGIAIVVAAALGCCVLLSLVLTGNVPAPTLHAIDGRLAYIRINAEVGEGYGGPSSYVDADVIVKLQNQADGRYVFYLRAGGNSLLQQGMLDLLMLAYEYNWTVRIEYWDDGRSNHFIRDVILLERD